MQSDALAHEAKNQLSRLIDRVMQGEEVVIAKAGTPVVKLVRVQTPGKRVLGTAAGSIEYTEGWDAPLTERTWRSSSADDISSVQSNLAVTPVHLFAILKLPRLHKDPFDRLLASQCMVEGLPLLSADPGLRSYPIDVIW